ncbi:uncharacterized protein [Procambarus clarkii]|uniref:uncharacterized protein isoform X2 n=1 Tax=Procambarus clarkii TaxID=6728 RepID=UPI003742F589
MGCGNVVVVCILVAGSVYQVVSYPIPPNGLGRESGWSSRDYIHAALGVAALLSSLVTLLACVCCKRARGFKELGSVSSRVEGSNNTLNHGPREEFTMFPPAGISHLSLSSTQINFEPLPDIRPRPGGREALVTDKTLPVSFPAQSVVNTQPALPTDDWFAAPHQNFPRNQLQYVREIGKGWFGQVLEGRATGIFSDHTKGDSPVPSTVTPTTCSRGQTPVAVKVLREDATPTEQMYFLHELKPYRDLSHPNVLKVLAQCLETEPLLILMQLCPRGDLKAVVRHDKSLSESAVLRMVVDVAAGLMHMHSRAFIHTDLAARNCVVDEDYTVKIGDYGYNIDFYKNEYYCAGEVALPLRWCSPETLKCTDTTIETKEVTTAANVWSFGIIMWEIASRGELPYTNLDDDQVIQQVIVDQSCILESPKSLELHADKLYNIMKQCWYTEYSRPPMTYIYSLLMHLWENSTVTCQDSSSISDFERRWDQLQQQHCRDHSIMNVTNTSDLRFESDFSLSVSGHHRFGGTLSPSLQNLRGSVEDLDAKMAAKFGSALPSWLGMEPGQPIDSLTQEITDAILKLDDYLAGEKSEPSTTQASPEKGGINFKLGKDSFVSNPPESKLARVGRLSVEEESEHPSLARTLSGEDEGLTMRLEQGEFTELVRLKSQSVQDFMKLTVVDDGSDSDNTSQRNSLAFEPLAQEKTCSSEGNIREALRDIKFMGDLERLQAEHRYSIISEASRENPSSIEYRNQDFDFDPSFSQSDILVDSEAGSTEKLATSTESDNSNIFHERQTSEHDPFLGEIISSVLTEENKMEVCDTKEDSNSTYFGDSSVGPKPLPASPDCVVSSREPKPVALPDIVVHDASVKLSTPSPPPVDSPLQIRNNNQPKEFRFIFENQTDSSSAGNSRFTYKNEQESLFQSDSVIFSENIRNTDMNKVDECDGSNNHEINYQRISSSHKSDSSIGKHSLENEHESESKTGDISKFLTYMQDNFRDRLTSTPCKINSVGNAVQADDVDDKKYRSGFSSNDTNTHDSDYEDRESSLNTVHFTTSSQDNKEDEQQVFVDRDSIEVPSYKPEKIITGEDVVIGALDDYSLDLYRAVKSTEISLTNEESLQKTFSFEDDIKAFSSAIPKDYVSHEDSVTKNKVIGIEVDLEQWDKFLGSTMNGDKINSDIVFKENFEENISVDDKLASDISDSVFEDSEHSVESKKEFKSDNTFVKYNSSDLHSTCDEIRDIMANDSEVECDNIETRPEVDVTMFFNSESSVTSNVGNSSNDLPQRRPKSNINMLNLKALSDDMISPQSGCSDESYITAKSTPHTTKVYTPTDVLDIFRTPAQKCEWDQSTPVTEGNSQSSKNSMSPKIHQDDATVCSESSSSVILDMHSDKLSYRREASVDCGLEAVSQNSDKDTLHSSVDIAGNVLNIISKPVNTHMIANQNTNSEAINNNSNIQNSIKIRDFVSKTSSTPVDSKLGLTSDMLSLESISSTLNIDSCTQRLEELDGSKQENIIIKDDLSPSAYETKLKSDDCWNSQESQDSAVENDEAENGDFWQQQMMAWQEAAFQTRQLLQQAAGGSGTSLAECKGSQEDLLDASPRSDSSSTKSLYSSSDMLSLDDEGTYVSYNTTDDEEVLGYKPEDINALRAELNLKLGSLQEDKEQLEPEEPDDISSSDRENVTINYRGIITTTLSPIKEESFLEDDDSPSKKSTIKNTNNLDSVHDQSIEFEELLSVPLGDTFIVFEDAYETVVNESVVDNQQEVSCKFSPEEIEQSITMVDGQSSEKRETNDCNNAEGLQNGASLISTLETMNDCLSLENTHDSLILEDLDEENGVRSIQIYDSGSDLDAEDILVVDTETNEAKIIDRGKPRSHLAFINDQEEEQVDAKDTSSFVYEESDDVAPESIPSVGGSRFDEMRHREEFLRNNPSWEKPVSIQSESYGGDSESQPEREFVVSDAAPESPQGIQVPHYHSYFTSALSTISHPNVSIEEPVIFEQVEHISLPYDVNYPSAGEQLHSLEDFVEQVEDMEDHTSSDNKEETKISEIEDDDDDNAPIKLNFLGRLYSDESEEKDEQKILKSCEAREATLLSDSENEDSSDKQVGHSKKPKLGDINQMTTTELLAAPNYQITDHEEIEEHLELQEQNEEDSEDDEYSPSQSPRKLDLAGLPESPDPRYTPDWESDSDSDGDSSSTSGEFMWRQEEEEKGGSKEDIERQEEPGEQCQQANYILDVIEEEPEDDMDRGEDEGDFSDDSESGEEEFTPSKWNCDLTPSHSLLKSPQNRPSLKKRVRWKRQRHHRVYEYPPEPRSWEQTPTEPHRRSWGRSSLDYLSLADWELGADEFIGDDSGDMEDYVYRKPSRPAPPPPIYSLGSVTYDDGAEGFLVDNGEFYIRSSGSPFTFTSSSFSASDFFPGSHSADLDIIFSGPPQTSGLSEALSSKLVDNVSVESELVYSDEQTRQNSSGDDGSTSVSDASHTLPNYPVIEESEQSSPSNTGLGQLRHTRDKLRLEIPTISLAGDAAKSTIIALENGESRIEKYNDQISSSINLKRTEPEVSEV